MDKHGFTSHVQSSSLEQQQASIHQEPMISHHTDPGFKSGNAELPGNVSPIRAAMQNVSLDGTLNVFNVNTTNWTNINLQHPTVCKASLLDTENVIWDSGAFNVYFKQQT